MSLRVIQLGPVPPPEGGITQNIAGIVEELAIRGHRSTLIATSRSLDALEREDVLYPRTPAALIAALRKTEADILHLHIGGDVTQRVLSMALACALFGKGKPVLTLHSGGYAMSAEARNAKRSSFAGFVFRRFAKVIAVNQELAEVFSKFGVRSERIEIILPFVLAAPDGHAVPPPHLSAFCEKHTPLLVSVGGLEKDYEPMLQIEAFSEVKKAFPNAGLMIIGGGSMKREVEAAVEKSDEAQAIMLADALDHSVVLQLIKRADAMLRITLFDGDAISVREGLFLGTPVIATDNGMRPEGVHLVPRGDADALTATISAVIGTDKPEYHSPAPDNSNVRKVVDLYEALARK